MLEEIKNLLWNTPTVVFIAIVGVLILLKTRFYVLKKLPHILRDTLFNIKKDRESFKMLCTALGGTIGVGNTVGVAGAIVEGGAGAVFWMCIAGTVGMAIKHCEVYLALKYKAFGERAMGPISYIKQISGTGFFPILYALLCITVSFGMGNIVQIRASVCAIREVTKARDVVISAIISLMLLAVITGGAKKISSVLEKSVPLLSLFYIGASLIILFYQRSYILPTLKNIMVSGGGFFCGVKWAIIKKAVSAGFSKGIFSTEAGLGSSGFAYAQSNKSPQSMAKWGVIEVLADTLISLLSALTILTCSKGLTGIGVSEINRTVYLFNFGKAGEVFFAICIFAFSFSSVLCWYYYGECALNSLTEKKNLKLCYTVSFSLIAFLAAFVTDSLIIDLSDIANAIMLIMNLSAVLLLYKKIEI